MKKLLKGIAVYMPQRKRSAVTRRSFCLLILLLFHLACFKAAAVPLPTIGFNCSLPKTATTVCAGPVGSFASGWTTPGSYWEWTVNTSGFQNIVFSTTTAKSSAAGPTTGTVFYNSGAGFMPVFTFTVSTACLPTPPIMLPPSCNNNPLVTVRVYMNGATNSTATNRVREVNVFDATPLDTFSFQPVTISQVYDATTGTLQNLFDVNYTYTSMGHPTQYLNLFVRDPLTGNKTWGIENLALNVQDTTMNQHYQMPLQALFSTGTPVGMLGACVSISGGIMVSPPMSPDSAFQLYSIASDTSLIAQGNNKDTVSATPADTASYVNAWLPAAADSVITHKNMPNIDLDSATYKADTSYAGDWNACGPASCANSMQWLEKEKKVKFDSVISHRNKLKAISKQMGRANNDGVQGIQMVKGKLGFIDRYKLPISVKFQDDDIRDSIVKAPDTTYKHYAKNESRNRKDGDKNHIGWDWLWQEMKLDKDVEIWFVNKNMVTNKWEGYSHYVVVTEVSVTKGVLRLKFKDDNRQDRGGNKDLREVEVTIDTTANGFPYVKERDDKPAGKLLKRTFIVGIYSEGPDTNIKFTGMKPAAIDEMQKSTTLDVKVFNNPMNDHQPLTVRFESEAGKQLQIEITDITGRLVKCWSGKTQAINTFTWNGDTNAGKIVNPGIYIISIHAGDATTVIKAVKE